MTQNMDGMFDMSLITAQKHWGKGYMREALEAFVKYMPKGSKLLFLIEEENIVSIKTVRKLSGIREFVGYEIEGEVVVGKRVFVLTI